MTKQRIVCYCDGTPSREVEEDWETTGQDEMNDLVQKIKEGGQSHKSSTDALRNEKYVEKTLDRRILDAKDALINLSDLLTICIEALMNSELIEIKRIVGDVLYFHVSPAIKTIEQEL